MLAKNWINMRNKSWRSVSNEEAIGDLGYNCFWKRWKQLSNWCDLRKECVVSTCHPFNKLGIKGVKGQWGSWWDVLESSKVYFQFWQYRREDGNGIHGNQGLKHNEVQKMVYRA